MILRHRDPRELAATGMIAPFVRVATHAGYCQAIAARDIEDEDWDEAKTDITEDMRECLLHLNERPDMTEFIGQNVIEAFDIIKMDIQALIEDCPGQNDTLTSLQNLAHNAAWAAAMYERSTSGNNATEGINI